MRNLLVFALFWALMGCSPAQSSEPATEIRGVWITNVDSDVMFSREALAEAVEKLHQRGFNTLFPVVWNKGFTLYPSDVMAEYFGEDYRLDTALVRRGNFDPLQAIIEEGRARGMTVIPWFEFGFAASYNADGAHLIARYPHWAAQDIEGNLLEKNGFEWMNGFHPEVQTFILRLVEEVITKYDVDGIQGDDRLPALPAHGGYDAYTRQLYAEQHNGAEVPSNPLDSAFVQWKADQLTAFGRRLYDLVKGHNPNLIVSLSPSVYPWSRDEYLQDWPAWIRAGQVDWLHPQAYRYEIDRYITTLDDVVSAWRSASGHERVVLTPGILIKAGNRFNGVDYVRTAMTRGRELGLPGEVFFFYEGLFEQNEFLADTLAATFYAQPARVPALPTAP